MPRRFDHIDLRVRCLVKRHVIGDQDFPHCLNERLVQAGVQPDQFITLNLRDDRTPEKLLASKQAIACMQQAIEALPVTLKEVLILRDAHGVTTKEVCKRLNISETNLYVRLHRARERVRVAVETALG